MTRREWTAAIAAAAAGSGAAAAAQAGSTAVAAVVARHDDEVARLMSRQVTNRSSRWCGAVPDGNLLYMPGGAGGVLAACITAYLAPGSRYRGEKVMVERARLAAGFLERSQSVDGNVDLPITNFNSTPDTGFVVHGVASAAVVAHRAGERELVGVSERFLRRAGAGMAKCGVHTPNHRWVVASALAQVNELFPHPDYLRRIDEWLAEGIDIDAEGQFTERSTGVYNAVVDRALVVLAAKLRRPELLDPVRRNLEAMMYLLEPGFEVVTAISRRQDQYGRSTMAPYWFPLRYLAVLDGDGRYAAIADHFLANASLTTLLEYPELAKEVPHKPVPEEYTKLLTGSKVLRMRRGEMSSTLVLEGDSHFAAFRRGKAAVKSVRFASAFFGKGQFVPERWVRREDGEIEMTQSLEAGYYQPLSPAWKVTPDKWATARAQRRVTEVCRLRQSATVRMTETGIRIRMRSEGTAGVPVSVELALDEGAKVEGCRAVPGGWLLEQGQAVCKVDGDVVRVGPGLAEHRYTDVRGALPAAPGTRLYLCGYTPFDHTVELG